MPTPENAIRYLRELGDNGCIRLPRGQPLRLGDERSKYCIKFNMRFGRSIHYEVGWGEWNWSKRNPIPGNYTNYLVVRLDVEEQEQGLGLLREQLRYIRDKLTEQQRNDDQILISKNTPKDLWFQISPPILCGNQSDEEIKQQVVDGLQHLYDVFEPTLIQFENQRNNNFTNAEPPNRSDSTKADMNTEIQTLLKSNLNVILTGAPGTGKTYTAKQVACAMTGDDPKAEVQPHIESVQFHPGYDYSDFVIGMKPVLLDEDGKEVKPEESRKGKLQVSFRWKDGIFKTFANKAKDDLGHNYVFLIDEINRTDLSRVFGELFSLLEEEYRYPNNKKGVTLPNGDPFVIPRNLFIIGTMNDIDRSVESMDFALRRRFAWYEVKVEQSEGIISKKVSDGNAAAKLKAAMKNLNAVIGGENLKLMNGTETDLRLGTAYQLGGAIFAKFEKCDGDGKGKFDALWNNHISNVLGEYLRGRRDREDVLKELKGIFDKAVDGASGEHPSEQNAGDISAPSDQPAPPRP